MSSGLRPVVRVAFYTNTILEHGGGLEKYLIELARTLAESDELRVDIITNSERFAENLQLVLSLFYMKRLRKANVHKESAADVARALGGRVRYIKAPNLAALRRLLAGYDVIYSRNELIEAFYFKFLLGYRRLPRVIFGCHTPLHYPYSSTIQARIRNFLYGGAVYRFLCSGVDTVHVLNQHEQAVARRLFPRKTVKLIGNPFDSEAYRAGVDGRLRPDRRFDGDTIQILWAGKLAQQKGVADLVELASRIAASAVGDRVSWNIFGDGELRPDVERAAREVAGVRYFGYVAAEEMAALYARNDIFLSTSKVEGYPYALLEAASMGLKVVAYDIAGLRDVVGDYHCGFLARSLDDLEGKLIELIGRGRPEKCETPLVHSSAETYGELRAMLVAHG